MPLLTINNFSPGLNTKRAPAQLPPGAAQSLVNAGVDTGHVVSLPGLLSVVEPTHNNAATRSVARWFGKDYWTENGAVPAYNSELGYVGLTPPTLGAFQAALQALPLRGDIFGEYRYCVTFETEDGWESAPNLAGTDSYYISINARKDKYPVSAWAIETVYSVGSRVSASNRVWECISAHTSRQGKAYLSFNTGTSLPVVGEVLVGATSGATGAVAAVVVTSGSFFAGNAAGRVYISAITGTWQAEVVNNSNSGMTGVLTSTGAAVAVADSIPGDGVDSTTYWKFIDEQYEGVSLVSLTDIPISSNASVVNRHIYRTTANGAVFYRVATIIDNVSTTHVDTMIDVDLLLRLPLSTTDWLPPPTGGRYLLENDGVFWVAVLDKLYFSQQSNPHAWKPLDFVGFDNTVTALVREFHGILVTTANRCFRVAGSTADTVAKQEIPAQQGCPNWRTIAQLGNAPIWYSNDGICIWDGSNVQIVTKDTYRFDFHPVHAAVANDRYYLFGDSKVLVVDFRNGAILNELDITCDLAWYDADEDIFYWKTGSDVFSFGDGADLAWTWRSGWLGENLTVLKHARRIWIDSSSPVNLLFMKDGEVFTTKSFTAGGRNLMFLPPGARLRYAEVEITGTGTLREITIEYEVLNP